MFLTCFDFEFHVFASLLRGSGIRMHRADTAEQADFFLTVTGANVLLCDTIFMDGTWHSAADMVTALHPRISLIVVAGEMESEFHREALPAGVSDLVIKPLWLDRLRRAIQTAHRRPSEFSVVA